MKKIKDSFFEFLRESKTAYHTVANICSLLDGEGYERLSEANRWQLRSGGKYYVVRNGSSVIAFRNNGGAFMIAASHSDFPSFRVKGEISGGAYIKLDVEKYGGLINYTWLDRPLSVAGRVAVRAGGEISLRLADIGDKRVVIPSLAIHMNRTVNESLKLNPASDLLPLASVGTDSGELMRLIAKSAGCEVSDIVSYDLYLYNADLPTSVGLCDELVLSPRLDDLGCVFSSTRAFLDASDTSVTPVLAVFDNEEVGSDTKQGAASTFLYDTITRICGSREEYLMRLASSFMISADNAHAIHPNHPELADKANAPTLGGGIVVKYNANQKYATDALSDALFRSVCDKAGVAVQSYYNRADLAGGSTLGSISDTKVSVPTVDIGIPQLAMHSATESCALSDVLDMVRAITVFYSGGIRISDGKIIME